MTVRAVRAALLALLFLALLAPTPAFASHAPSPPAPCHPRGCQEALVHLTQMGGYVEADAAGARIFHGGSRTTSGSTTEFAATAFDVATDTMLWTSTVSVGTSARPFDAAVSPDGATFLMAGEAVVDGSLDAALVALDTATGATRYAGSWHGGWSTDFADAVEADDARGYVASRMSRYQTMCNGQPGGNTRFNLSAFDVLTGAPVWAIEDNDRIAMGGLEMRLVGSRLVYTGQFQSCTQGFRPITAVDAATGQHLWTRHIETELSYAYSFDAIEGSADGSVVYLAGHDYTTGNERALLWALNAATGATLWTDAHVPAMRSHGVDIALSPDGSTVSYVLRDRVSFSTYQSLVRALSTSTGALLWEGEASVADPWTLRYSPAGDAIVVSGLANGGAMEHVMSAADGARRFRSTFTPQGGAGSVLAFFTADGEHVVSTGTGGLGQSQSQVYFRRAAAVAPPEWPESSVRSVASPAPALRVSWLTPEDDGGLPITSYAVSRSTSFGGPFSLVANVSGSLRSFDDASATPGVEYYYHVHAWNAKGESPTNTPSGVLLAPPSAPQNVAAEPGDTPLTTVVTWDAPATNGGRAIKGYRVLAYDAETGALLWQSVLGDPDARAHAHASRLLTTYVYEVRAYNDVGEGAGGWSACSRGSPVGSLAMAGIDPCVLGAETTSVDARSPV